MKLEKCKVFGKYTFYYLPNDKYVGQRVALEKYEPYLTDLMLSKIKIGDVVLDIGANIGYDTVLFAERTGKTGKVIAIEPDPINFEILQKNIKENKLFNVVAVQAAVGSENKKMGIYESKENYGDHRMWEETLLNQNPLPDKPEFPLKEGGKSRKSVEVFCRRLDDLLKDLDYKKIDFIKMDVQGFEPLVIDGGKEIIEKNKPTIFFEYWPWGAKNSGSEIKEMMEFFRKIYKKIFWVDEYIQVQFPASQKFLDKKYSDKNEDDYGNLWVKEEINFNDRLGQFKDFWIKKLIKRILGRPET
ncbi:MAG: FkbM family methyltransferase [Candidatus Shapirobacteria bacterium]|jgi:FkbM family methyltransferase